MEHISVRGDPRVRRDVLVLLCFIGLLVVSSFTFLSLVKLISIVPGGGPPLSSFASVPVRQFFGVVIDMLFVIVVLGVLFAFFLLWLGRQIVKRLRRLRRLALGVSGLDRSAGSSDCLRSCGLCRTASAASPDRVAGSTTGLNRRPGRLRNRPSLQAGFKVGKA